MYAPKTFGLGLAVWLTSCLSAAELPAELAQRAYWPGRAPNAISDFHFVVLSDRTGAMVPGEWEAAVAEVNLLHPDFVLGVGDLIPGNVETPAEIHKQWDEFEPLARRFEAPFFTCPGNHDVGNGPMLQVYRQRYAAPGETWFSFDYRSCHFVFLDSTTAMYQADFARRQLAWLQADMQAAAAARRVFVIFHHPRFQDDPGDSLALWNAYRGCFPPEKTIIFNGHDHRLGGFVHDGLTCYTLASTGAEALQERESGSFRMYARVAVTAGEPKIALIPLHEVLPASYADHTRRVWEMLRADPAADTLTPGRDYTLSLHNPLEAPITVRLAWQSPGWEIAPPQARLELAPGARAKATFTIQAAAANAVRPRLEVHYDYPNPLGRTIDLPQVQLPFMSWDIPILAASAPADLAAALAAVPALRLDNLEEIYLGRNYWSGPADLSYEMRTATDGERLLVSVDVTDDQLVPEEPNRPWLSDGVIFYWDTRPPEKRDSTAFKPGTGMLLLALPRPGAAPAAHWYYLDPNTPAPAHLAAHYQPQPAGYRITFSLPLREIGSALPVRPGPGFNFELQVMDADRAAGRFTRTWMNTSGRGQSESNPSGYLRGRFR